MSGTGAPAGATAAAGGAEPLVAAFWDALYTHDWTRLREFFDEESIYYDVPTGPSTAAKGPDDIVARLRLGLDGIAEHAHGPRVLRLTDGDVVMTEHTEIWRWHTGEEAVLPFVSVQWVRDGVIAMWKDYWDYNTLLGTAPQWWQDRLFGDDLDWIHDATGHPLA